MDLAYSDEQVQLRDSVLRYTRDQCSFETRSVRLADGGFDATLWSEVAELGWFALPLAEEVGGLGGSAVDLGLVMEGVGRALIVEPIAPAIIAGLTLSWAGDASQRAQWLDPFLAGETVLALAFAEPENPLDLTRPQTAVVRDGAGWRLSGQKAMVVGGDRAAAFLVPASLPDGGLGLFVVPTDRPGVTRRAIVLQDQTRVADIQFDSVELEQTHLLSGPTDARAALDRAFDLAIAAQAAEAVGAIDVMVEMTLEYLKTRQQFGKPLSANQALQHRMVDIYMAGEEASSAALSAALAMETSSTADRSRAISLAKIEINRLSRLVAQEAVQLHGAIGTTEDLPISHYFRRLTLIGRTFGGTDWHIRRVARIDCQAA
ncbi:acyl-CoA dehydrogenase family protein [Pseudooceanicola sp.]|uniref:acyl-CoA dehydrogenase family protein n=1 Tax=Pseudooceanicola sp. TaxID=1914328 RepID=UPI0035C6F667